jgi:hypothetical protein
VSFISVFYPCPSFSRTGSFASFSLNDRYRIDRLTDSNFFFLLSVHAGFKCLKRSRCTHCHPDIIISAQRMTPAPKTHVRLHLLSNPSFLFTHSTNRSQPFSTTDTLPSLQYIGICSTPVYMLESACGACQNRTFISWTQWTFYCPADKLQSEGTYNQIIPGGTLVPHWAYLKPSDYDDFFNANAAKLVGGELTWRSFLFCFFGGDADYGFA